MRASNLTFGGVLALVLGLGAAFPGQASAQDVAQAIRACTAESGGGFTPQQQIDGCTVLTRATGVSAHDMAMVYYSRGLARVDTNDQAGAVADFGEAISRRPVYPDAYLSRGSAFTRLGRYDEAVADFTRAIAQQPGNVGAYFNRGNAHARAARIESAIVDYNEVIRLDPLNRSAWANRGVMYRQMGDIARADADTAEANRLAASQ